MALSAPMLVAATGIAVDVGYWNQEEENLQSAADAGALAVAQAAQQYGTGFNVTIGEKFAVAAANNATNAQYKFTTSSVSVVAGTGSTNSTGASITPYTVTASAPRNIFFAGVTGLGLPGMGSGTQGASATVNIVSEAGSYCMHVSGTITVTGGAKVYGTNCGVYSGSTACASGAAAITVSGSGQVIGTTGVATASNCVSDDGYTSTPKNSQSGYIGTNADNSNNGDISTVTLDTADPGDPLAGVIGTPPSWPVMPSAGTASSYKSITNTNPLNLAAGNWLGLSSLGNSANTLNYGTSTGITYISGGLGGSGGNGTTLNGSTYYINGGINFGSCWNNSAALKFNGTYYNVQSTSTSNYAATLGCSNISVGSGSTGGQYYFDGGLELSGSATTINLSSGLYEFLHSSSSSCTQYYCGSGAFNTTGGSGASIYFGTCGTNYSGTPPLSCATTYPATYYFDGGLNISSGYSYVYFNPGIYYIRHGYLYLSSGAHIIGTDVTFVFEDGGGFILNGGATVNITAPTTNCVSPSAYPESAYTGTTPYDGTNGEGICGIAFYQESSDSTADIIDEGNSTTINGAIYIPSAALSLSGAGSLTVTTSGVPAITAASVSSTGSGNVTMTENTANGASGSSSASTAILLVK